MARPASKKDLLEAMEREFRLLTESYEGLSDQALMDRGACEDWSVKDLLAHLDAWHRMFLTWEEQGSAGEKPDMPAPGFTWAQTPALNEEIWNQRRNDDLTDVIDALGDSYGGVRAVLEEYGADELFEKKRFPWTGTTSVGSYAVSATSSHYAWAAKLIRAYRRVLT